MTRPKSAVLMAQEFIAPSLTVDGIAVDATAGNGHDTAFMAKRLKKGKVYSFDIQQQALDQTANLLGKQGLRERVKLIKDGHEQLDKYTDGPVDAVMFNLGYLPGGDHNIITEPENTVTALQKAIKILRVGGRISLVVYTGHDGGLNELNAVKEFLEELDSRGYWVIFTKFVNRPPNAPVSFFIERVI